MQTESRTKQTCLFFMPRRRLSYPKIMQTESRTKQTCLFFMPRFRLSYLKIMQTESRKKQTCLFFYAEEQLILSKDNANRVAGVHVVLQIASLLSYALWGHLLAAWVHFVPQIYFVNLGCTSA